MPKTKASKAKLTAKKKPAKPKKKDYNQKDGHIGFFVTSSKNETAELPITPPEITMNNTTDDAIQSIVNLGEINRLGHRKLRVVKVESFMPWHLEESRYVNARNIFGKTKDYISFFKEIQDAKKPIQIVVSQTSMSMKATLQSFEYGFKDGNAEEYYYSLTFVEHRQRGAKKASKKRTMKSRASDGKQITTIGTVKKGVSRPPSSHKLNRASEVYVTGEIWNNPNKKDKLAMNVVNAMQGVIGQVKKGASHPYQVKSVYGGIIGWASKSNLKAR